MAYILHIDTSGNEGVVAVAKDGELVAERTNADTRNHAAVINLFIDELLKEVGIVQKDLSAIAVCGGPGSYTGLRIGLATAKAMCYVLDIPLLHHDRLLLLTLPQINDDLLVYEQYAGLLPAREKEYFLGIYDKELNSVYGPQHILVDELERMIAEAGKRLIVTGKFNNETEQSVISNTTFVDTDIYDTKTWAKYAFKTYVEKNFADLAMAEPYYLKQVYTHK